MEYKRRIEISIRIFEKIKARLADSKAQAQTHAQIDIVIAVLKSLLDNRVRKANQTLEDFLIEMINRDDCAEINKALFREYLSVLQADPDRPS